MASIIEGCVVMASSGFLARSIFGLIKTVSSGFIKEENPPKLFIQSSTAF
ncbi:MAG: hypothetical protein ACPK7O_07180 [Methanobacterium sp.]